LRRKEEGRVRYRLKIAMADYSKREEILKLEVLLLSLKLVRGFRSTANCCVRAGDDAYRCVGK